MRDLKACFTPLPGVMVFDFQSGRITAMNDAILNELKTKAPTQDEIHGENIQENRATNCLFDRTPLPPGLASLKKLLYQALERYLGLYRTDLTGKPVRHRSWCNHYKPNEGVPWHDHAKTPVVSVYSVRGLGGDLIIQNRGSPNICHRIETPPCRMIIMPGALRHCSTPNFGPKDARVALPINFYFD